MQMNTDGLVIRQTDTGENDRIVTVLTKDYGIIRAFANGAKRIKSSSQCATQLLSYSRFSIYQGKESYIINEAQSIEVFFKLRQDIERLTLAQYFCELAGELAPEMDEADDYLKLMLNSLSFLANGTRPQLLLKALTELRMLCLSGYMPDLTACESCGKFEDTLMFFDKENGQLFCSECSPKGVPVGMGVVTAMRHICYSEAVKLYAFTLPVESLKLLSQVTESYLATHIQRKFKTLEFFNNLTMQ
ncbi:MAG: DNA repair protein RecO [Eubacteriales bacterium]